MTDAIESDHFVKLDLVVKEKEVNLAIASELQLTDPTGEEAKLRVDNAVLRTFSKGKENEENSTV